MTNIAYGGTIDPSTPDKQYIEFGEKFYCIFPICGTYNDNTKFCASCVIIDSNHILTAAHVVENYKSCHVSISDKINIPLESILIHKDFNTEFGMADIALGFSKIDFKLEYYPELYEDTNEIGKLCSISGYGLTGTFNTGAIRHDNKRRAGSNKIEYIDKNLLICNPSKRGGNGHTSLEFFIASGDSGGGLFIDGKLAGINSCVMVAGRSPVSKYGEESGHTRISKFIDWIKQNKTRTKD
jgi:hypothetical protein